MNYICDICGSEMTQYQCKVLCTACGARWDCSDLFVEGEITLTDYEGGEWFDEQGNILSATGRLLVSREAHRRRAAWTPEPSTACQPSIAVLSSGLNLKRDG